MGRMCYMGLGSAECTDCPSTDTIAESSRKGWGRLKQKQQYGFSNVSAQDGNPAEMSEKEV